MNPARTGLPAVAVAHVAFVLTGTVTTLLGPILPTLVARWSLSDAAAGYLFTAQFAGSIAGTALSGVLVQRAGFRRALGIGLSLMAAGTGGLPLFQWPGALILPACYGVGLGITIPATNLFVAEALSYRRSAALNILNLAWAAGAVAAPPVFARMAAVGHADRFLFGLSGSLVALALGLGLARSAVERAAPGASHTGSGPRANWKSSAFASFAALFFFYVGTENAVAGWVAVHADRIEASTLAASMPTVFWGALMIGRGLAPLWLRWTTETAIVLLGLTLAAAGIAVLLGASDLSAVVFGTAMSGLGLAAVFPTTIAQLSREFGETSSRIAAAAFLFASLGGATLPWLVGVWSTAAGDLRRGLLLPLMGCLAMIALHAWRPRARGRTTG